ncbi:MAG: hypothetical protein WC940_02930 [Candidatus Paceibacterota bacterium]|jgi:hypothetical protein
MPKGKWNLEHKREKRILRTSDIVENAATKIAEEFIKVKHWPDEDLLKAECKRLVEVEMWNYVKYVKEGVTKFVSL